MIKQKRGMSAWIWILIILILIAIGAVIYFWISKGGGIGGLGGIPTPPPLPD